MRSTTRPVPTIVRVRSTPNTAEKKTPRAFSQMPAWIIPVGSCTQVKNRSFTRPKRLRMASTKVTTRICRNLGAK